MLQVTADYGTS